MTRPRFTDLFGSAKPVIAMAHLRPLPGTPLYDERAGVDGIVASLREDLEVLLAQGVDAVMFCNEGDRPYTLRAGLEGVATLARVVTELRPKDRPFGVDFLWDAHAALAVAAVTGASFIREVTTGVYESDMGLWNTDAASLLRERRRLGADHVQVLMNVTPEFASQIGTRSVGQVARSAVVSSLADAILVSGPMAGAEPDLSALTAASEAVDGAVPVLLNTGAKSTNIATFLTVADGVIVGSDLKVDGGTWNPVHPERVRRFMEAARS
ncbi:MAG: BtpA/SgcQ family protein [Thermoleophilia bacterium]|nr:BtpA/SgcQ family protein [Thermoleophilia bacterium]